MSDIPLEDVLNSLQEREDAVRNAVVVFDKGVARLQESYSLPADRQQWPRIFASRLAAVNKEYRQNVKHDLQSAGHNLKHLYAEGGDGDGPHSSVAMQLLVTMVITALDDNRRMNALLEECTTLHDVLVREGRLALADRVFMRKSLPDLVRCSDQLSLQAKQVKDLFDTFKPAFYVIAYERDSKWCQQLLSARKLTRSQVEQQATAPFTVLSALAQERATIIQDSMQLAIDDGIAWCSLPSEYVALEEFERELAKFDDLRDRACSKKISHEAALILIRELEASALATPATLPGADGREIPVGLLRKAFDGYEHIRASCTEMLQLSEPIVEMLTQYVRLLRGSELLARAYSY